MLKKISSSRSGEVTTILALSAFLVMMTAMTGFTVFRSSLTTNSKAAIIPPIHDKLSQSTCEKPFCKVKLKDTNLTISFPVTGGKMGVKIEGAICYGSSLSSGIHEGMIAISNGGYSNRNLLGNTSGLGKFSPIDLPTCASNKSFSFSVTNNKKDVSNIIGDLCKNGLNLSYLNTSGISIEEKNFTTLKFKGCEFGVPVDTNTPTPRTDPNNPTNTPSQSPTPTITIDPNAPTLTPTTSPTATLTASITLTPTDTPTNTPTTTSTPNPIPGTLNGSIEFEHNNYDHNTIYEKINSLTLNYCFVDKNNILIPNSCYSTSNLKNLLKEKSGNQNFSRLNLSSNFDFFPHKTPIVYVEMKITKPSGVDTSSTSNKFSINQNKTPNIIIDPPGALRVIKSNFGDCTNGYASFLDEYGFTQYACILTQKSDITFSLSYNKETPNKPVYTPTQTPTTTPVPTDTPIPTYTHTPTPTLKETYTPSPTPTSTPTVTPQTSKKIEIEIKLKDPRVATLWKEHKLIIKKGVQGKPSTDYKTYPLTGGFPATGLESFTTDELSDCQNTGTRGSTCDQYILYIESTSKRGNLKYRSAYATTEIPRKENKLIFEITTNPQDDSDEESALKFSAKVISIGEISAEIGNKIDSLQLDIFEKTNLNKPVFSKVIKTNIDFDSGSNSNEISNLELDLSPIKLEASDRIRLVLVDDKLVIGTSEFLPYDEGMVFDIPLYARGTTANIAVTNSSQKTISNLQIQTCLNGKCTNQTIPPSELSKKSLSIPLPKDLDKNQSYELTCDIKFTDGTNQKCPSQNIRPSDAQRINLKITSGGVASDTVNKLTLCDLDNNKSVNTIDLLILANAWKSNSNPASADIDGDGVVNSLDYSTCREYLGSTVDESPASDPTPTP